MWSRSPPAKHFAMFLCNIIGSCVFFCPPCCKNSAILLLTILPSSCPTFGCPQANILQSSSPKYCRPVVQYSAILISNILKSSLQYMYCRPAVQYSAILISNILQSSCPIYCSPEVQYSSIPISSIQQSARPK